jgi:ABC-type transport system involved in multi-copper enzyme maturation permease subunit
MTSYWALKGYVEIARNTVSAIVRSKVLYLVVFLTIVIIAISITPLLIVQMASEAGEVEAAVSMTTQTVGNIVGLWVTATYALALFLGASAISSEVKAKTIVTVLAKPVERWRFLLAKWVGMEAFLFVFFVIGVIVATLIIQLFDAQISLLFWVGVAQNFLIVTILGTAALALSTVSSPVFAGGLPILISILAGFARIGTEAVDLWVRLISKTVYFLLPASMPANLVADSFRIQPLDPDWGLYGQVLLENGGYALVLLALGCVVFQSRELRLK